MPATVQASYYGGSAMEPAGVNAETGIVFSQSDAQAPAAGVAPVDKPTVAGTNYSYIMLLAFEVIATAATDLSDRMVFWESTPGAGTQVFFADQATYRRPASGNQPNASGSDGPDTPTPRGADVPGSYDGITTTPQGWDATAVSTGSMGRNGDFVELVAGIDSTFAGMSDQYTEPDLILEYTEG
ncbi:MAG: hypothetical protein PHQ28_12855 [Mycobacterium sp.]|nr:hypothetical protein [Mycobacterium sp.]